MPTQNWWAFFVQMIHFLLNWYIFSELFMVIFRTHHFKSPSGRPKSPAPIGAKVDTGWSLSHPSEPWTILRWSREAFCFKHRCSIGKMFLFLVLLWLLWLLYWSFLLLLLLFVVVVAAAVVVLVIFFVAVVVCCGCCCNCCLLWLSLLLQIAVLPLSILRIQPCIQLGFAQMGHDLVVPF